MSTLTQAPRISLSRPPITKEELWYTVGALFGVWLPKEQVCADHQAPFDAFADAYFGNEFNWALWYGSRGTGKSYMLALLALTKASLLDIQVVLLGGSMAQSQNVHEHVENLMQRPNAPRHAVTSEKQTELEFTPGSWIRPLPASQKTVRGPHPHMTLLDEIDEMDKAVYDAAMGQALNKENTRGIKIGEMVVASSTWQRPIGTFQEVIDDARVKGMPVFTWCLVGTATGVITRRGEVDITEVTAQDEVLTRMGWRGVQHVTCMGMRKTITVEMSNGRALRGTPDHLVASGGSWVPLGALRVGDLLTPARLELAEAGSAVSAVVVGGPVGVLGGVGVPGGAVGSGDLRLDVRHPPAVLGDADLLQVVGVHAGRVLAGVIEAGAGVGPGEQPPHGAVGHLLAEADASADHPVVGGVPGGLPLPAAVLGDDGALPDVLKVEDDLGGKPGAGDGLLHASDAVAGLGPPGDGPAATQAVSVVGIHDGVIAEVWDIGVEGAHEFVANGVVVHNCYREVVRSEANPTGWMDADFIERKRKSVPAEMFRVEYELGEPAGDARAFDLEKVRKFFVRMTPVDETHSGNYDEWVYARPEPNAVYAIGADWAKEKDKTVFTIARVDTQPRTVVYICRMNRRDWPSMIAKFNDLTNEYRALSAHDATGLGNVIADMVDERSLKVELVDRKRTKLLTEYIVDFEQGKYLFPLNPPRSEGGEWSSPAYQAHRATTVDAVYAASRTNSHLPDDVASAAIMHRAAERGAPPARAEGVAKTADGPSHLRPLDVPKDGGGLYFGVVRRDTFEDMDEVGVPLLPAGGLGDRKGQSGVFNL